jgi:predicted nucleic acid-binding protein
MRFWDSSAVVPLVVRQPSSAQTDRWLSADADVAIWTLTPVEVLSALRRLAREGSLGEDAARAGEDALGRIVPYTHVVIDVERVKRVAGGLLRLHPLRAADALQLAAALTWADGSPGDRVVHTFDPRLGLAASREGVRVRPAP